MEESFWHEKWERGEIAFHEGQANVHLVKYFSALKLPPNSRVFVPLCGKTKDIAWLLTQGYQVVGVELSELAIQALFDGLDITPTVKQEGDLIHYQGENIDIFVGDIFSLTAELLKPISAIYDRAALVALPEAMRKRYSEHLISITHSAPQLLISFDYDQHLMAGPPFSVNHECVHEYYDSTYSIDLLESAVVSGGLKGKVDASELVWLLQQ